MAAFSHFTPEASKITVGIVTHNSAGCVRGCLESIAANLADAVPSVIIVDNASSDDTLSVISGVRKNFPFPVSVIPHHQNRGYAWAANRICEQVKTEWLCLINPDARLLTPAFQPARELARRIATAGVAGGIVVDPEGKPQECGGVFPTPLMAVWDWCGLRHLFPRKSWSTTLRLDLPPDAPPRRIDYPTGAFWILRTEVYRRVGPFDEQFFLYFEETDFCRRARRMGWPSYLLPSIRVEHRKGASFASQAELQLPDALSIYFESLVRYLRKHFRRHSTSSSISCIDAFLRVRKWIRKDEKSERIFKAFREGLARAGQEKAV